MNKTELDVPKPSRASDSFEAIDLSQIPTNAFFGNNQEYFIKYNSPPELEDSETSKSLPSPPQHSLESVVRCCLNNQNCITEINPKFMCQLEKCAAICVNQSPFLGFFDFSPEASEIPDECMDEDL